MISIPSAISLPYLILFLQLFYFRRGWLCYPKNVPPHITTCFPPPTTVLALKVPCAPK